MRIIALRTLRKYWEGESGHANAKQPLLAWYRHTKQANWASPGELKAAVRSASILANNSVVFNIGGNKYRLLVVVNYPFRVVCIRFIGTHKEYDKTNAETI